MLERRGGLSYRSLDRTDAEHLRSERLTTDLALEFEKSITRACATLEALVGMASGEDRNRLLQLRRDLYNGRWLKISRLLENAPVEGFASIDEQLRSLLALRRKLEAANGQADLQLPAHLQLRCSQWRTHFLESEAVKGLILSAPEFWQRLAEKDLSYTTRFGLSQDGFTLMQYVSRCATKPSPFSYFAPVRYRLADTAGPAEGALTEATLESHAVVNTQYTANRSLVPATDSSLPQSIRWNSSLQRIDNRFLWLLQVNERDLIRTVASARSDSVASLLSNVTTQLDEGKPAPSPQELDLDLRRSLYQAGILLEGRDNGHPSEPDVPGVQELLGNFRLGSVADRHGVIREIRRRCSKPELTTGKVNANWTRHVIREDVIYAGPPGRMTADLETCARSLAALESTFYSLTPMVHCRRTLARWLRDWAGGSPMTVVAFLERLLQRVQPQTSPADDRLRSLWHEILTLSPSAQPPGDQALNAYLKNAFAAEPPGGIDGTVHLRSGDFSRIVAPANERSVSGAYVQICGPGERWQFVVNGSGLGSGRCVRRWFTYNPEFRAAFKGWMDSRQIPGEVDALIVDDVHFHADHGPTIFETFIETPGAESRPAGGRALALRDLTIAIDDNGLARLQLGQHGPPIHTHYDSLLLLTARPLLTQFLAIFSRSTALFNYNFLFKDAPGRQGGDGRDRRPAVSYQPRVVLDDRIVLRRAAWIADAKALPPVASSALAGEIVRLYQAWRRQAGLPEKVFVHSLEGATERGKIGARSSDGHKPQYIDFTDPAWVLFFHKYVSRTRPPFALTEALPNPALRSGLGSPEEVAQEYVIHWSL